MRRAGELYVRRTFEQLWAIAKCGRNLLTRRTFLQIVYLDEQVVIGPLTTAKKWLSLSRTYAASSLS